MWAEYCGVRHYAMRGGVEDQNDNEYQNWLEQQKTFSDLIAKQERMQIQDNKFAKKNDLNIKKDIYIEK